MRVCLLSRSINVGDSECSKRLFKAAVYRVSSHVEQSPASSIPMMLPYGY